jgi:hypothetical protein
MIRHDPTNPRETFPAIDHTNPPLRPTTKPLPDEIKHGAANPEESHKWETGPAAVAGDASESAGASKAGAKAK